jgi:hypothetical protein
VLRRVRARSARCGGKSGANRRYQDHPNRNDYCATNGSVVPKKFDVHVSTVPTVDVTTQPAAVELSANRASS